MKNSHSLFRNLILSFRPKTLTAALVPCLAASALAQSQSKSFAGWILLCALFSSVFIQIGTNLINDAVDFKKGADTEARLGPQRITQVGILNYKTVMLLGAVSFLLALLLGIPLVIHGGISIVIIGLISIFMGYAYTAGPFPLAYRGLGDLFVILFFGIVAVMGMNFLYSGQWSFPAFILGLQIGLLATVLIAVNNLRDIEGDRSVNKRTLAVRLGKAGARGEILLLCVLPYLIGSYWFVNGPENVFLFPLLTIPLAGKVINNILENEPSPFYNKILAQSAALHLLFGLCMCAGFVL